MLGCDEGLGRRGSGAAGGGCWDAGRQMTLVSEIGGCTRHHVAALLFASACCFLS